MKIVTDTTAYFTVIRENPQTNLYEAEGTYELALGKTTCFSKQTLVNSIHEKNNVFSNNLEDYTFKLMSEEKNIYHVRTTALMNELWETPTKDDLESFKQGKDNYLAKLSLQIEMTDE